MKEKQLFLILLTVLPVLAACQRSAFDPAMALKQALDGPSAQYSSLTISNKNVADGISPADVRIVLKNALQEPMAGMPVSISVTGSNNVIVPCTVTDANGTSRCTVYSTKAEWKTVMALAQIQLEAQTNFEETNPFRNSFAFVSAGNVQKLPSGHRIISSVGIYETSTNLLDAGGKRRAHSSILGSLTAE